MKIGIKPIEYRLVVKIQKFEEKTKGGIYLCEDTQEKEQWKVAKGHIVEMSDMAFTNDGNKWPCTLPKVGDFVMVAKYQGQKFKIDGNEYRLLNDKDILAVLDEEKWKDVETA